MTRGVDDLFGWLYLVLLLSMSLCIGALMGLLVPDLVLYVLAFLLGLSGGLLLSIYVLGKGETHG